MPANREVEAPQLPAGFRQAWHQLRNDYAIGTNSRFRPQPRGVRSSGSGADYHYRSDTDYMRGIERSRAFMRDNMIVAQGVRRLVANVVQDGFQLDVQTPRKPLNRELKERWEEWAGQPDLCDYEGEKTFGEMESLVLQNVLVDGDMLSLPLRDFGSLQNLEAHRLRTPRNTRRNVVHGVLLEEGSARRREYWITNEDLEPHSNVSKVGDITARPARDAAGHRQVLHLYNPDRFSQRRGVTVFAPAVDALGMHDDIQFAHLVQAQVASCFAILEEYENSVTRPSEGATGAVTTETLADGSTRTLEGISPGMRVKGVPGSTLKGFSPNIPNPEFFPHAMMVLTFIAVNLDLPVAVLLLDPSNTNFSGWRGAIDQARLRFKLLQKWLRTKFHEPVYRWKLRQWAESNDRLAEQLRALGPDYFAHRFNSPTWRYIEPAKDALADDLRVTRNLVSQRRRAAEQGIDWDQESADIISDRVAHAVAAFKAVERANRQNIGLDMNWREAAYGTASTSGIRLTYGEDLGDNGQTQESTTTGAAADAA